MGEQGQLASFYCEFYDSEDDMSSDMVRRKGGRGRTSVFRFFAADIMGALSSEKDAAGRSMWVEG